MSTINEKILVALSGGKDSSTLLHMTLQKYEKKKIYAVICNHNIRKDSKEESKKIQSYWKEHGVKVYIIHYRVDKYNSFLKNQNNARKFRLNAISLFAIKHNINIVLLGHNLEDKIETYLFRKEQQSTFWGLASIGEKTIINNVIFTRPLLHTSRKYIDYYIEKNNIFYIEDSSNIKDIYRRNYIRHNILPKENICDTLKAINHYVNKRKLYHNQINEWTQLHLIQISNFAYKFLWNRLPVDQLLSKLILGDIFHKIRGKPVQNWEKILLEKRNFHLQNVSFTFRGSYMFVEEFLSDDQIHKGKTIYFNYKLLLYSDTVFECKNHKWPIIQINENYYDLSKIDRTLVINRTKNKIKVILLGQNFLVSY